MKKHQKEILKSTLDDEKKELKHLKAIYKKTLQDISGNIKLYNDKIEILLADIDEADEYQKSVLQSQIYHRDFQKNLQKQLNAFLSDLNNEQYKSINDYIEHSYEGGYIATMYDIAQQGIPIIAPIDQKKVIKAMSIDSKISKPLYEKLGEDVDKLKKRIANNISRGIASADSYQNIARNIANDSNVGFNRAMRIARTEGHRVHQQAAFDAQHVAKDKGADVVKQWNSVLDGRVRTTHRKLDGQLREVDEPFEMDGKKAMHPSGFGRPEEDINCRCVMLQRARWALDDDELETLKERAVFHGLDKAEDFEDFKKKYLKAADAVKNEKTLTTLLKQLSECKTTSEVSSVTQNYFRNKEGCRIHTVDFGKCEFDASKEMAIKLDELDDKFHSGLTSVKVKHMNDNIGGSSAPTNASFIKFVKTGDPSVLECEMELNENALKSKEAIMHDFNELHRSKYSKMAHGAWVDEQNAAISVFVHEYGHTICPGKANEMYQDITKQINSSFMPLRRMYNMYMRDLQNKNKKIVQIRDSFAGKENGLKLGIEASKEAQAEYDAVCISKYSKASVGEFIAEAFCDATLSSKPREASVRAYETLVRLYGKGKENV